MKSWKKGEQGKFLMNIINKSRGLKRLALSKLVSNLVFGHSFFKLPFSSFLLRYKHRHHQTIFFLI